MDSTKVFIDTDTEVTFILEKILKSKHDRVCLVVPDRAAIFNSISTLKLIKRIVDKSSKLLVMVTLDESGANLARRVGIITVPRVGDVNEDVWEKVQREKFEYIKRQYNTTYTNDAASNAVESVEKSELPADIDAPDDLERIDLECAPLVISNFKNEEKEKKQSFLHSDEDKHLNGDSFYEGAEDLEDNKVGDVVGLSFNLENTAVGNIKSEKGLSSSQKSSVRDSDNLDKPVEEYEDVKGQFVSQSEQRESSKSTIRFFDNIDVLSSNFNENAIGA